MSLRSLHAEQNKTGRIPEKNQIKMTETEKKTWQWISLVTTDGGPCAVYHTVTSTWSSSFISVMASKEDVSACSFNYSHWISTKTTVAFFFFLILQPLKMICWAWHWLHVNKPSHQTNLINVLGWPWPSFVPSGLEKCSSTHRSH